MKTASNPSKWKPRLGITQTRQQRYHTRIPIAGLNPQRSHAISGKESLRQQEFVSTIPTHQRVSQSGRSGKRMLKQKCVGNHRGPAVTTGSMDSTGSGCLHRTEPAEPCETRHQDTCTIGYHTPQARMETSGSKGSTGTECLHRTEQAELWETRHRNTCTTSYQISPNKEQVASPVPSEGT